MARIRVTPIDRTIEPAIYAGRLEYKIFDNEIYYFICGHSFPAKIVTVLEGEAVPA